VVETGVAAQVSLYLDWCGGQQWMLTTWAIAISLAAFSDPTVVTFLQSLLSSPGLHRVQGEPGPISGSGLDRDFVEFMYTGGNAAAHPGSASGGNAAAHPGSAWCGCCWTTPAGHSHPPVPPIDWGYCTELDTACNAIACGHEIIPAPYHLDDQEQANQELGQRSCPNGPTGRYVPYACATVAAPQR
jgi:hypothetical protein